MGKFLLTYHDRVEKGIEAASYEHQDGFVVFLDEHKHKVSSVKKQMIRSIDRVQPATAPGTGSVSGSSEA